MGFCNDLEIFLSNCKIECGYGMCSFLVGWEKG